MYSKGCILFHKYEKEHDGTANYCSKRTVTPEQLVMPNAFYRYLVVIDVFHAKISFKSCNKTNHDHKYMLSFKS